MPPGKAVRAKTFQFGDRYANNSLAVKSIEGPRIPIPGIGAPTSTLASFPGFEKDISKIGGDLSKDLVNCSYICSYLWKQMAGEHANREHCIRQTVLLKSIAARMKKLNRALTPNEDRAIEFLEKKVRKSLLVLREREFTNNLLIIFSGDCTAPF